MHASSSVGPPYFSIAKWHMLETCRSNALNSAATIASD
jgi:hypothetical protein